MRRVDSVGEHLACVAEQHLLVPVLVMTTDWNAASRDVL